MKKIITTYILCFWSIILLGQTTFSIEGGHLNIDQSVSLVLENTTLNNDGNITADSGTVFFINSIMVTGQSTTAFHKLMIDNANNNLDLFQNTMINHQLEFINGQINLNDFQLELTDGASCIGMDENNYIQINGTGQLIRTIGNTPLIYPIGASTFNPAYVSNTTSNTRIGIVVRDTTATKSVNRVWQLQNLDGNPINAEISLLWDNQLAAMDFDANESAIIDLNNNNDFTTVFSAAQMSVDFPILDFQVQDSITQSSIFMVSSDVLSSSKTIANDVTIQIYPNPATDFIMIEGVETSKTVQIFSEHGQLMKEFRINSNNHYLRISNLSSGSYLVKMGEQVKKLIIQK